MKHRMVELSHPIEDGMITYKGLPAPLMCDFLSHEASREHYGANTEFHIGKIEMVANTGTYIDAPFHRFREGIDIAQLPLISIADLPGIVVPCAASTNRKVEAGAFHHFDVRGKAVLVQTGWDRHWNSDQYFKNHPFLTKDAALHLRDAGAALVGVDSLNIDDTEDGQRPVHTVLLGAGIPIVEHLTGLDQLLNHGFRFYAPPAKVKGMGSFPVRAFAILNT